MRLTHFRALARTGLLVLVGLTQSACFNFGKAKTSIRTDAPSRAPANVGQPGGSVNAKGQTVVRIGNKTYISVRKQRGGGQ